MFGMEAAQEQIQSSLGNVKKPDFPEQSFYAEALNAEHCVEQKNEGMAPSNGPTEDNQKNLEKAETPTERKLDQIKAEADKMGEEHTEFNAFDELENYLFTIGEHLRKNSRIYTSAGTTLAGGALGAAVAHRQAKKTGKTGSEYRKLIAKKAALGAATGLAVGEASHIAKAYYKKSKFNKNPDLLADSYMKGNPNFQEGVRRGLKKVNFMKILKSKRHGYFAK